MKYFEIGKIVNTQGIKGEIRVLPTTDDPKRFELLKEIEVFNKNIKKIYTITTVRYHKKFVILKLKEINDMNEAETLKNNIIKITEDKVLPLKENEYYIQDLYGMSVITIDSQNLGKITDILLNESANDVYVVKNETTEILIPAIKQCVLAVDVSSNTMTVNLLEGLI